MNESIVMYNARKQKRKKKLQKVRPVGNKHTHKFFINKVIEKKYKKQVLQKKQKKNRDYNCKINKINNEINRKHERDPRRLQSKAS